MCKRTISRLATVLVGISLFFGVVFISTGELVVKTDKVYTNNHVGVHYLHIEISNGETEIYISNSETMEIDQIF